MRMQHEQASSPASDSQPEQPVISMPVGVAVEPGPTTAGSVDLGRSAPPDGVSASAQKVTSSPNTMVEPEQVEVEHQAVGRYASFVAKYPWLMLLMLVVFITVFIGVLRIPGYFALFEGGDARKSKEAQISDAFLVAQDWTIQQFEESVLQHIEKEDPFTEEASRHSIQFFFHSKSGDVLSPEAIGTQVKILSDTEKTTQEFCVIDASSGGCKSSASLMQMLSTTESDRIRSSMSSADATQKDAMMRWLGADADFEAGTSSWVKARVRIGGPLPGYHNLSHNEDDQEAEYGEEYKAEGSMGSPTSDGWIAQINDHIKAATEDGDMEVFFSGGDMLLPRMFAGLFVDVGFALAALILVGSFMWVQVGSVFLAVAGMLQILLSYVLTMSTWKLLGNGSFTFMHGLVIYIILGIGADNIFVFCDAWKQSRAQPPAVSGSAETRLQWTLSKSFKAMSVTSITTCGAFLLTSNTDIPVIATFGSYACLVIVWNLVLVVSWFPACVLLHDQLVVHKLNGCVARRACGCACVLCAGQWGLTDTETAATRAATTSGSDQEQGGAGSEGKQSVDQLRAVERFFHGRYFEFLQPTRTRLAIVVVFSLLFVGGIIAASTSVKLTQRAVTETYLVDGNPLQTTLNLLVGTSDAFGSTSEGYKEHGVFMFGVDPDRPIDRAGTDPLAEGELEQKGLTRLVGQDFATEEGQRALLAGCDKIRSMPSVATNLVSGEPEVYCFIGDFKTYREAHGLTFPVPHAELVDALTAWRHNMSCTGAGCFRNFDETGVSQGVSRDLYDERTGFLAEGDSIVLAYVSGNLSLDGREQELSLISPEYDEWRTAGHDLAEELGGEYAVIGLTGRLFWIAIMRALIRGVVSGVPASLVIALGVLTVSTANWRVAGLASLTILGVMSSFFITFAAAGWELGMYECMFLQLTAGMAVDYVVHLAHAYNECKAPTRGERMRESMTEMGVSVLSGAISTLGASILLFVCQFRVFYLYGSFIFFVILWAILWALLFFPTIMIWVGPEGDEGTIPFPSLARQRKEPTPASAAVAGSGFGPPADLAFNHGLTYPSVSSDEVVRNGGEPTGV